MAKLFNRAKMTTSTTGTGTITLGSASTGFQTFADAGVSDGDVVQYVIEEGANFEIGTGTYTASGTTLSRTPSESSNSDAAITLAGAAQVAITAVASQIGGGDRDLSFDDNAKAKFGAGDDLQIYHDGSHSFIHDNGTGNLYVRASNALYLNNADNTQVYADFANGGGANLYHNNAAKLSTTSTGISVTGNATFADNGKAIFGAGSDLQIYHDGSASYITENGAGSLFISGTNMWLKSSGGDTYILCNDTTDTVSLYQANSKKLETTSTGIDVTGTVTADGLTVDGQQVTNLTSNVAGATRNLLITNTNVATNNRAGLYFQPSNGIATSYIDGLAEGDASTTAARDGAIVFGTRLDGTFYDRAKIASTGDISFYEDTGTTAKFFWDASAERLGIGTSSPAYELEVEDSSSNAYISIVSSTTSQAALLFGDTDAAARGGILYDNANNSLAFRTATNTERMRIDSSGNVMVGTTSSFGSSGITLGSNVVYAAASSQNVANFQRYTTDGEIVRFGKDGTTVGSIGVNGDRIYLTNAQEGIMIDQSANNLSPTSSTGTFNDNAMDLGESGNRWKDLYLSGTAIVGDGSGSSFGTVRILGGATSGYSNLQFADDNDTNVGMIQYSHASNYMQFTTNDSERMRIDSSGNLLVGKTSLNTTVDGVELRGGGQLAVTKDGSWVGNFNRKTSDGDIVSFQKDGTTVGSIGSTAGTHLYVGSGDTGLLYQGGADAIEPWNPSTNSARDDTIDLGLTSNRFRKAYLGQNVFVRTTSLGGFVSSAAIQSNGGTGHGAAFQTDATSGFAAACFSRNSNNGAVQEFFYNVSSSAVGTISITSSQTTYNTTSDRRLKTDIQPIAHATDMLMAMNPVTHKWKAEPDADAVVGFIAQEMQEVVPEAVTGDPDGDEMMAMDYGRITPVLVAALQDAHKKIEALEARLSELEAN